MYFMKSLGRHFALVLTKELNHTLVLTEVTYKILQKSLTSYSMILKFSKTIHCQVLKSLSSKFNTVMTK